MSKTDRYFFPVIFVILVALVLGFFVFQKTNSQITESAAIAKVKVLSEVAEYLKRVPEALIEVNGEEDKAYLIQVYEIKDNHTATYNWYTVDKKTGEVKKMFP